MKLRWWLWLLLGLLLLPTVAVTVLLSTQWGLETTLAAATRVLPGKLSYRVAQGSLLGPLRLEQLHYQDGELEVQLRQGELDWSPGRLLNGTFRLDQFKLDGLELRVPPTAPSKEPTEPFKLSDIPLPLAVEIVNVEITDLRLRLPGAEQSRLVDAIRLRDLAVEGRNMRLGTLEVAAPEGHLDLSGQLQLTDQGPLDLHLKGALPLPPYGPVNLQGRLVGELANDLAVELTTTGTATATLEGTLSQVLTDPGWSLRLQLEALELGKFNPDLADRRLSGRLQSQGKPTAFQAGGQLNSTLPQLGATTADIQLSSSPKMLQLKTLQLRAADHPLALTAGGTLDRERQRVDFTGNWHSLVWPLQGPPQVEITQGEFTLQGTLQNYTLALQSEATGPELGRLNASVQAKGTEQMLTINALSLGVPDAQTRLNARGELKFADLAFQAEGDWQALRWPPTGTAQLESQRGTFKTAGTPQDYRFNATVQVQGPDIPAGDWSLDGQGTAQGLPQLNLTGRLLEGELRATSKLTWQPALRWQAELSGNGLNPGAHWPQFPGRLAVRLQTQGSLMDNSPEATLDLSELSGILRDQAVQGRAQLAVKGQELQIPNLQLTAGGSRLQADGSLTQNWDLRWQLATPDLGQLLPGGTGSVSSSGNLSGPRAQPRLDLDVAITNLAYADTAIQRLQGRAGIDASGTRSSQLRFEGQGLRVAGQTWKSLTVEGGGTPAQHTLQGRLVGGPVGLELALSGSFDQARNPQNYRFNATVHMQGPDIPAGDWNLEGQGTAQGLPQLNLTGRLLEGELRATLNLAWQPALRWQAELSGNGLNPGGYWSQFPGRLAVRLQTQGSLVDNSPQATLELSDLSGVLRGQAIKGQAQLAVRGQELQIPSLQLTAGGSRLQASGSLTQNWDLRWQLVTLDLGQLLPGGTGSVSSSGNLSGPRAQPRLDLDVAVTNLAYADTAIQRLQGRAGIDASGTRSSQVRFEGQGLRVAGQDWKSLTVEGGGTPAQHNLQGRLVGGPVGLELALSGSFDQARNSWQGRLQRLLLQDTIAGDWRLAQPLPLQLSAQQVSIDSGCLVSPPSRLCLQGNWNNQAGAQGRLSLERLGLERFAGLLPPDIRLDASLSGEAQASRQPNGTLQGRLDLQLSPGRLHAKRNGSPVDVPLEGDRLQAAFTGQNLSATAMLGLGRLGGIQANLRARNQGSTWPLNGKVMAEFKDLGLISTLVPQVEKVSGRLTANIDLTGTLAEPVPAGELNLRDAAVEIPRLAVRIQAIQLAVTGDGRGPLRLSGSARSGAGTLALTGQWQPTPARLELGIRGENFEVANLPEARVLINPDLKLALAANEFKVEGQVVVPEARLGVVTSSGETRVRTSPDVVIVDQPKEPTEPSSALAIQVRVRVILGNKVEVNAYDFRGRLEGNVLVEQTPEHAPTGTGSIGVRAGEYIISGQRLQIERGQLLFTNSPLDNPGLNLRVTRTVENFPMFSLDSSRIVVGAEVNGTLQRPRLDLFSQPPMPDSSILSYLVLGQAPLTAQQSSFILGKYLSPQLYVGYGVGLYNAVNTFIVRYRLSKRILLEATSSTVQTGADVFYTIEGR